MAQKPKVSVVIPVYNAEPFLRECLDSVVNQTLQEIEIIIINDGSTDGSLSIIEEYSALDPRITYLNEENGGDSRATNMGLDLASGEYVTRLDADDYAAYDMYEKMYETAVSNDLDVLRSDYINFFGEGDYRREVVKYNFTEDSMYNRVMCADEFSDPDSPDYLKIFGVNNVVWNALYKCEFLNDSNIRWDEDVLGLSDNIFFNQVMALAKRILFIRDAYCYHRTDTENSIMHSPEIMINGFHLVHKRMRESLVACGCNEMYGDVVYNRSYGNMTNALNRVPYEKKRDFVFKMAKVFEEDLLEFPISDRAWSVKRLKLLVRDTELWYQQYIADTYKVSVIMPVYNAENTLRATLDSLMAQTLTGMEIILIDDGSTDSSPNIMREYQKADEQKRITIITQENKGAGIARNVGIRAAHGIALSFLDADDHFYPRMLELAFDRLRRDEADVCLYRAEMFDVSKNEVKKYWEYLNSEQLPNGYHQVFHPSSIKGNPFQFISNWAWDKMFLRSFILKNNIHFAELYFAEDQYFSYTSFFSASKITTTDQFLIRRNVNHGYNITSNADEFWMDIYQSFEYLRQYLINNNRYTEWVKKCFLNKCINSIVWQMENALQSDKAKSTFFEYSISEGFGSLGIDKITHSDVLKGNWRCYNIVQRMLKSQSYEKFLILDIITQEIEKVTNGLTSNITSNVTSSITSNFSSKLDSLKSTIGSQRNAIVSADLLKVRDELKGATYWKIDQLDKNFHTHINEMNKQLIVLSDYINQMAEQVNMSYTMLDSICTDKVELNAVKMSLSYKLGYWLTAPFRAVKRIFK